MKFRHLLFILFIPAVLGAEYKYYLPYVNLFHIPGEVNWSSRLNFHALCDSTIVTSPYDTLLLSTCQDTSVQPVLWCGTQFTSNHPLRISYYTKSTTANEYEPTEFQYNLLPSLLLGREYFVPSLKDTPAPYEFVSITSTTDGNRIYVDGVFETVLGEEECDTFYFRGPVMHITSDQPIAVTHISQYITYHAHYTACSILPTKFWGEFYVVPRPPELWGTGYTPYHYDSTSVIIVALMDSTLVDCYGFSYVLNAGERLRVQVGSDSAMVDSSAPVEVIHYFNILAQDYWTGTYRSYSATSSLISNRVNTRRSHIAPLVSTSHGGPRLWIAISSLADFNVISFDIGCEGEDDHMTLLNKGETFYLHDTLSILPGADSVSTFIHAEKPIQILYSYRGWWRDYIESHWEMTDFIPNPMPFIGVELFPDSLFCLPDGNISPNPMRVEAVVYNNGDANADSIFIELILPPSCCSFAEDSSLHWLGTLAPAESVNTSWQIYIDPACEGDSICFNARIVNY